MNEDGPAEDRLAIRELIEAFAHAVMQRNDTAVRKTFAEDGEWMVTSLKIQARGRDAIMQAYLDVMEPIEFAAVFANPASITVGGNRGEALCYQQEFVFRKDGSQAAIVGHYVDDYVKLHGRWYFQSRVHFSLNEVPGIGWVGQTGSQELLA